MPSTDAYGNPDFVADGEFIEDEWGNAVVSRTVRHYPTWTAWNTDNPAPGDGETFAISDQLFVVRGGRLVSVSDYLGGPTSISGANVSAGGATSQLTGTLPLPTGPWDMDYIVFWSGMGSGHAAAGGVTPSIRDNANSATVYGTLPEITYLVGNSPTWSCIAKVPVDANTTLTLAFWVQINGASANLNIGGVATVIGIPR